MLATIAIGITVSVAINLFLYRLILTRNGGIFRLLQLILLLLAGLILVSAAIGGALDSIWPLLAFLFVLAFLGLQTLASGFWGKMVYATLTVVHLFLGAYLYTLTQLPYGERPFAAISSNQPRPLNVEGAPVEGISGLPLIKGGTPATLERIPAMAKLHAPVSPVMPRWADVEMLMQRDSHIRVVLVALREKQERDLSEMLAGLNNISVTGTAMRRHAIDRSNVENLLRDGAISTARYHTILETWNLTDRDERAFRAKQSEELFHALLQLLEDPEVDESHKVDLIEFMTGRYAGDVRIVKPLINLYDRLDEEYPRQKRLNREFLDLYLRKRRVILSGFRAIGRPALQPLLDYRKKTTPEVRYSQARLDRFLEQAFHARVRPLYGVAEPLFIRDFLNREKYPPLGKFQGPSYSQDYLRRSLLRISRENRVPEPGQPVMGLAPGEYSNIVAAFERGLSDEADRFVINQSAAVRANAAWVLAQRKDPYTVPLVFELMRDSHPEVRRLAAVAAGNFRIVDMQNSNDRKFSEIVGMLQNYRTNADAFARAFALSALATVGDRQQALYVIDLVLNDGETAHSVLGESAPAWKSEDEKSQVHSLVETLRRTPEEPYVKTQALKVLLAMDTPESLGILLHHLNHIYRATHTRPGMWRYIVPHMTLTQEAENVEDLVYFQAGQYREHPDPLKQPLKTLRASLSSAYEEHQSGEFFQYLSFLKAFDAAEYHDYVEQTGEHVLLMQSFEYLHSSYGFWLVLWPLYLFCVILLQYGLGFSPRFAGAGRNMPSAPNRHSNPAADIRNLRKAPPAAAVVPIKMGGNKH